MSLFGKKEKQEIEHLKAQMSPEQIQLSDLSGELDRAKKELHNVLDELSKARHELSITRKQIIETDEAALMQSFGVYTPHYSYTISDEYRNRLMAIRDQQKELIKSGLAS